MSLKWLVCSTLGVFRDIIGQPVPSVSQALKSKETTPTFNVLPFIFWLLTASDEIRLSVCLQNALLQDTVRRECEERYELTEALAQAREQVMELKKHSGNFPLSLCSLSQGNLTSSAGLANGHGQKSSNRGKGRTPPGLCGISRTSKVPSCSGYKSSNMSGPDLPALQPSSASVSSLDESRRRRITAAIRRQLSQQWCFRDGLCSSHPERWGGGDRGPGAGLWTGLIRQLLAEKRGGFFPAISTLLGQNVFNTDNIKLSQRPRERK